MPERDWKVLRELKSAALERFCARVLHDAGGIAAGAGADGTNHQRYLMLFRMIQNQDREMALAFDDHRRSTALINLVQLHSRALITEEEFARFTEETRRRVLMVESLGA